MKITAKSANTYGYFSIAVMLILALLILFEQVPRGWYYPLFAVALTLYLIRLTMRLILAREERLRKRQAGEQRAERQQAEEQEGGSGSPKAG